jgi:hypothetical protein
MTLFYHQGSLLVITVYREIIRTLAIRNHLQFGFNRQVVGSSVIRIVILRARRTARFLTIRQRGCETFHREHVSKTPPDLDFRHRRSHSSTARIGRSRCHTLAALPGQSANVIASHSRTRTAFDMGMHLSSCGEPWGVPHRFPVP